MANLGQMGEVTSAAMEKRGTASAPNLVIQVLGPDDQQRSAELYTPPGISSAPTPNDKTLAVPVGQGGRIVIAVHNYKIEVPVEPGEMLVYSTDPGGENVKASARFGTDGSITVDADGGAGTVTVNAATVELGGSTKSLVTHGELDRALQTFVTALNNHIHTAPSGATLIPTNPMNIDISASEAKKVKTE